jgi:hypothetical protein
MSPNRPVLIFVGLILSMALGTGVVVIAEAIDQGIRGERQLAEVLGGSPIISMPYIYLDEELNRQNKTFYYIIGGMFTAVFMGLFMVHLFFKPLDVIWFMLLRKFGIN